MSKKKNFNKNLNLLKELLEERKNLQQRKQKVLSTLFKLETCYLESTKGMPITKMSDYYINNRIEKKKYVLNVKDRLFSKEYPSQD